MLRVQYQRVDERNSEWRCRIQDEGWYSKECRGEYLLSNLVGIFTGFRAFERTIACFII
jgi:hypothetical protein